MACDLCGKRGTDLIPLLDSYKTEEVQSICASCVGVVVVNSVTQEFYGRSPGKVYVDYDAARVCSGGVAQLAKFIGYSVHLPLIGGGLANGDVGRLMGIFREVFSETDATLWLK
jgi:hypothetical protein